MKFLSCTVTQFRNHSALGELMMMLDSVTLKISIPFSIHSKSWAILWANSHPKLGMAFPLLFYLVCKGSLQKKKTVKRVTSSLKVGR